jgi:cell division protein FtsA
LVLAEIIEPRVTEIFALIQREIIKAGCEDLLTSGIVVTGGGARLAGISHIAEQVFNLPVRIGAPAGVGGLTDIVRGLEYGAAVGLVLHGASYSGAQRETGYRGPLKQAVRRVFGWFTEHF